MERLNDELLVEVLRYLDFTSLCQGEVVSREWQAAASACWRPLVRAILAVPESDAVRADADAVWRTLAFAALPFQDALLLRRGESARRRIGLSSDEAAVPPSLFPLISSALAASSMDNLNEDVGHTLEPALRVGDVDLYWSSAGTGPDREEWLHYGLMSSLCVVTELHLEPFCAEWQDGEPVFSPRSVQFLIGGCGVWTYESPVFVVEHSNERQVFRLAKPALAVGGEVLVRLLGKHQEQEADELYYTCIGFVDVRGLPLTSLTVRPPGAVGVQQWSIDSAALPPATLGAPLAPSDPGAVDLASSLSSMCFGRGDGRASQPKDSRMDLFKSQRFENNAPEEPRAGPVHKMLNWLVRRCSAQTHVEPAAD